jgi:hypothetical protein
MADLHPYHARVVPARYDDGLFIVRKADPMIVDRGAAFLVTIDDPVPDPQPYVQWAVDGPAASVESNAPDDLALTYVIPQRGGAALLHAYVGPPVDVEIQTPIFAYRSFFLGCASRDAPLGVTFDRAGASLPRATPIGSDLYVRGSACGTRRRAASALVAPLGTSFAPTRTLAEFAGVSAREWRPGGPTAFGFATYGTVLARLRDGRTLKFFMWPGARTTVDVPYILAPPGGEFQDVRFLETAPPPIERRLPANIRIPSGTLAPQREGRRREVQYAGHSCRPRPRSDHRSDDRSDLSDLDLYADRRRRT